VKVSRVPGASRSGVFALPGSSRSRGPRAPGFRAAPAFPYGGQFRRSVRVAPAATVVASTQPSRISTAASHCQPPANRQ
jgi:hypothetical protein